MSILAGRFVCRHRAKRIPLFLEGVPYCMACGRGLRRHMVKITLDGHQVRFPGWTHVGSWGMWGAC